MVAVVADLLVRRGLQSVLAGSQAVELVAVAHDLDGGRRSLRTERPDLVIVGDRLAPLGSGAALLLLAEARGLGARTVVLTDAVEPAVALSMIDRDASGWGWLLRRDIADAEHFVACLIRVGRGGTVVSDEVVRHVSTHPRAEP